jgi:hypothetical protein
VVLVGPVERVQREFGHITFLVSTLFPTAFPFLPTSRSIPWRRPAGKERRSDLI